MFTYKHFNKTIMMLLFKWSLLYLLLKNLRKPKNLKNYNFITVQVN
jgi:hypothetical protein